jgi:hypothetical protein
MVQQHHPSLLWQGNQQTPGVSIGQQVAMKAGVAVGNLVGRVGLGILSVAEKGGKKVESRVHAVVGRLLVGAPLTGWDGRWGFDDLETAMDAQDIAAVAS